MKGIMIYFDEDKNEINKVSLLKLPIKEDEIIRQSTQLYNESEPCIIYRTTIINKMGIKLRDKLELKDISDKYLNRDELKALIGDILNLPIDVVYVKII